MAFIAILGMTTLCLHSASALFTSGSLPSDTAEIFLTKPESSGGWQQLGNASIVNKGSGASAVTRKASTSQLRSGKYLSSAYVTKAGCISVTLSSSQPVRMYLVSLKEYLANYTQASAVFDTRPGQTATPVNGSKFDAVTSKTYTVKVDPKEAYSLLVYNSNTDTANVTYTMAAYVAGSSMCSGATGSNSTGIVSQSPATPVESVYLNITGNDSMPVTAVTGASCIAFGIAARPGAKNFEYTDNFDSNIASNASTMASMLDVSMFVMSNTSQLLWMSREFPKIYTDNACVISKTNPGPCYRYIDGLNPNATYFLWQASGWNSLTSGRAYTLSNIGSRAGTGSSCSSIFSGAKETSLVVSGTAPILTSLYSSSSFSSPPPPYLNLPVFSISSNPPPPATYTQYTYVYNPPPARPPPPVTTTAPSTPSGGSGGSSSSGGSRPVPVTINTPNGATGTTVSSSGRIPGLSTSTGWGRRMK